MTDSDLSIEEKRVYDEKTGATEAYVASSVGVVRVSVSDDLVGAFNLALRGQARDVAAGGGSVAVAGADDLYLSADGEQFERTGFTDGYDAPAVVGLADGRFVAADVAGTVAGLADGEWTTLGTVDDPRAVDAGLVATAGGVYRVTDDGLSYAGLSDVVDVAGRGVPLAATDEALYALGNGWMPVREGAFATVDSDGERAHAVRASDGPSDGTGAGETAVGVLARESAGGEWSSAEMPTDDPPVGFAYGPGQLLAVTEDGTMLATVGDGWRHQSLGIPDVTGVAVR